MFKQILLIALLSFSAAQAKAELGDHWIDFFWDFFDNPGTFLTVCPVSIHRTSRMTNTTEVRLSAANTGDVCFR